MAAALTAEEKSKKLKETLPMLRAIVQSSARGVLLERVASEYRALTYQPLPFRALGFFTLEQFLRSVPDTVQLENSVNGILVKAVADQSTAKLQKLINKQKKPSLKKGSATSFRRPATISRGFSSLRGGRVGSGSRYQPVPNPSRTSFFQQAASTSRGGHSDLGRPVRQPHVMASAQSRMLQVHAAGAAKQRSAGGLPVRPLPARMVTFGGASQQNFTSGPPPLRTGVSAPVTSSGWALDSPAPIPTGAGAGTSPSFSPPTPSGSTVSSDGRPPKPERCAKAEDISFKDALNKQPVNKMFRITGFVVDKPHDVKNQRLCKIQLLGEKFDSQTQHPSGGTVSLVYQAPWWNWRIHTDPLSLTKGTELRVYGHFIQQQTYPHMMVQYYEKRATQTETPSCSPSTMPAPVLTDQAFEEQINQLVKKANGTFFNNLCNQYKATFGHDVPDRTLQRLEAMQSVRVERMLGDMTIVYPRTSSPEPAPLQTTASTTAGMSSVGAPSGTSGNAAAHSTPTKSISNGSILSSQPRPGSTNTITSNEPLDESDELLFHPQSEDNYKNKLQDYICKVHGGSQENLPRYHAEAVGNQHRGYVVALGKTFSSQPVRTAKLAQFVAAKTALNYFTGELASSMAKPAQISATEQTPATVRSGSTMSARPSQQVKSPARSLPPPSAACIWDEIAVLDTQYIDVHVTHINGPYDIYARWFDCRAEYEKLEADLEERYADGQKPDVLGRPRVDGICLIEAPNKLYYRGKIQALLGSPVSKAEVFCLDHGDVETVELSSIFELPHDLYTPPFQAFLLSLNDVAAESDAPALLEEVIDLTGNKDLVAEIIGKVHGSSRLVVELWNTEEEDVNINAVLRSRFTSMHSFAPNLPDVGERSDVYISYLSKSGRDLTVQMVSRGQAKLEEIMEEMNKHFSKTTSAKDFLPGDKLHDGKVCCARYSLDKQWYRAVILKVLPGTREAEVRYMDYGNTEVLPTSFLRDITSVESWISKLPAQAIQCVLHDLPEDFEMSAKAKQFMDDVMADSVVLEVVKEAGKDHPALVQLFIDRNGTELNCNDEIWYLTNDESKAQTLMVEGGAVSPAEVESTNAELSADSVQQVSSTSDLAGDKDAAVDLASSEPPAVSILQPSPSPDSAAKFSAEKTDLLFLSPAVDDMDNLPSLPPSEEPSDNEYGPSADGAEGNGERDACDPPQFSIVPLRPAVGTDMYTPVVFPSGEGHNPGNFVVSVGADSWSEYEVVEEKMTTFYSTEVAPKPAYTWRAGHIAAAKTSIVPGVDSWVRVRVESIHEEDGRCFTLDYGSLLTIKLADLQPLQKEFCQVPSHTIRCSIHGVAPAVGKEWSTAACALFTETVCTALNGNVMCGFTKIMDDVQPNEPAAHVHLVIVPESEDQADKDINQILINAGHAVKAN